MPPAAQSSPSDLHRDRQKKPRHRHSPAQLAALNELFEKDEHPALELRQSLAERLGMETKTVNAWFQNKRASSKKRTVTRPLPDSDTNSISLTSNSHPSNQSHSDPDYFYDDIYSSYDYPSQHSNLPGRSQSQSANSDYPQFLTENDTIPRRMRVRPSIEQTEELKKLFNINHHPSTEQRQSLADRIGMRYQSVTNWFQNQRSIAKKKKDDDNPYPESSNDTRTYSGFPPPSQVHPSLGVPPPTSHPSLPPSSRSRRSLSPGYEDLQPRRSNPRRSVTPYSISMTSRPRRSRPEPHQLAALNDLYNKNAHPSIEERTSLALEIGMDLGKVTNWFRNLRQTKRRHAKKAGTGSGSGDEDDYYPNDHHVSVSRSGSPSSSSSMEEDGPLRSGTISGSEDEYEEPVTPRSESSPPSPSMPAVPLPRISLKALSLAAIEPAAATFKTDFDSSIPVKGSNGIKIEDALLLLTFHRQDVRIDI